MPGAVERACCFIIVCQVLLVASYCWFAQDSYIRCVEQTYLNLAKKYSPDGKSLCDEVPITMNDVYMIDDSGYWDTSFEWAFADAQLGKVMYNMPLSPP
jgi:uncharacterized membrane protein